MTDGGGASGTDDKFYDDPACRIRRSCVCAFRVNLTTSPNLGDHRVCFVPSTLSRTIPFLFLAFPRVNPEHIHRYPIANKQFIIILDSW